MSDAVRLEDPVPASQRKPFVAPAIEAMGELSELTQQGFSIPP